MEAVQLRESLEGELLLVRHVEVLDNLLVRVITEIYRTRERRKRAAKEGKKGEESKSSGFARDSEQKKGRKRKRTLSVRGLCKSVQLCPSHDLLVAAPKNRLIRFRKIRSSPRPLGELEVDCSEDGVEL